VVRMVWSGVIGCGLWGEVMKSHEVSLPIAMRPAKLVMLMAETWSACQRAASVGSYASPVSLVDAK